MGMRCTAIRRLVTRPVPTRTLHHPWCVAVLEAKLRLLRLQEADMVRALGTHVSYIAAAAQSEASPQLDHYLITSACKLTFRAATECTSWGGAVASNADLRAVNELSTTAPSNAGPTTSSPMLTDVMMRHTG